MTTTDRMKQACELQQQTIDAFLAQPCGTTLNAYISAVNEFTAAVEYYIRDLEDSARFFQALAARLGKRTACPHQNTTIEIDGYRGHAEGDVVDTEHVRIICLDCGEEVDIEPPDAGDLFDAQDVLP